MLLYFCIISWTHQEGYSRHGELTLLRHWVSAMSPFNVPKPRSLAIQDFLTMASYDPLKTCGLWNFLTLCSPFLHPGKWTLHPLDVASLGASWKVSFWNYFAVAKPTRCSEFVLVNLSRFLSLTYFIVHDISKYYKFICIHYFFYTMQCIVFTYLMLDSLLD